MRKIKKYFVLIISLLLLVPSSTIAYDFDSVQREETVKGTRIEIYDLYNLYKEIVNVPSTSKFGVVNYNGVCSTVNVDGKSVPLDDYIAGVVKRELGSGSIEVLKAQAIAARSFLLYQKKNSSDCSVTNGQSFQAYASVDESNPSDQVYFQAARETSGMVVSRNGGIANTQYQSYPAGQFQTEDSSGWHVKFQRWSDDPSSTWTWNGPPKATVKSISSGVEMDYNNAHNWGMSQTIARYLANAEGYTYQKIIELFYAEPIVTLSDGNYSGNVTYLNSDFGQITYFNQGDYPNYYYSEDPLHSNKYGGTIKSHGCGPTSAAIVASSILKQNIDPVTMTQKVCLRGGCTSDGSYNDKLGETLSGDYGLTVKMSNNNQEVINALGSGNSLVIVLMGPGTFTKGGHFIVLTGVNSSGQVSVADPASRDRTNQKWFSFNTIIEQRKTYANYTIVSR